MRLECQHNADLFDDTSIVRWLGADDWVDVRDLVRLVAGGRS